ncbi:DUF4129 domain-containing protein [Streptomyces qinzhouensis]|uniref:DUF4129 domain-containing protein n=1 Tax=Streptomyces qinzhouensis TaxID=2599401 RepID=A0A5B8II62_9ACTN|nr:DUF4129 domain-containing protein [Streptomyces qinzhouensis]QDY77009.1 DUF4129 domain-containing protein [Streptomyces qinzhouensis]
MLFTGGLPSARPSVRADGHIPVDISRDPAREAAERELTRPMYHENDPNLLQRAGDRFWEWVEDILGTAAAIAPGGAIGLVAVILIVAGLIGTLWWRLGIPQRLPTTSAPLFEASPRSAAQHRTAAESHAAAHRWNEAVQERMRAVVRSLEERALLDPRPGRTADEAAEEGSRSLPAHSAALRSAARDFDDVTYGGRTAGHQAYQRLRELDLSLERARPRPADAIPGGGA